VFPGEGFADGSFCLPADESAVGTFVETIAGMAAPEGKVDRDEEGDDGAVLGGVVRYEGAAIVERIVPPPVWACSPVKRKSNEDAMNATIERSKALTAPTETGRAPGEEKISMSRCGGCSPTESPWFFVVRSMRFIAPLMRESRSQARPCRFHGAPGERRAPTKRGHEKNTAEDGLSPNRQAKLARKNRERLNGVVGKGRDLEITVRR
jgi:hypothetical protein